MYTYSVKPRKNDWGVYCGKRLLVTRPTQAKAIPDAEGFGLQSGRCLIKIFNKKGKLRRYYELRRQVETHTYRFDIPKNKWK